MKYVETEGLRLPAIAVGCMGFANAEKQQLRTFIAKAMEGGMNFFDHADIYGRGACETAFAEAVKDLGIAREDMILQSKCGIIPKTMFDFSEKHILEAVEGSLERLDTDYLDCLLLHRPDELMQPEEVAAAFDKLYTSGKVRHFGVSNMHPYQIELLKTAVGQQIYADQLQFSPAHAGMISCNIEANMETEGGISRDGYILNYCRLKNIIVQAWSPFRYGFFVGLFLNDEKFAKLNDVLAEIGQKYDVDKSAVVAAWILRHPAKTQVITGTVNPSHLAEIAAGADVTLTREEWYRIYLAAGHILP